MGFASLARPQGDPDERGRNPDELGSLRDAAEFARVRVDAELGTICWPGGADLAPESLCAAVTPRS